jgi:hypothetical protein
MATTQTQSHSRIEHQEGTVSTQVGDRERARDRLKRLVSATVERGDNLRRFAIV